MSEYYINSVSKTSTLAGMTLSDVCEAAVADKTFSMAAEHVQSGQWHIIKNPNDNTIDLRELKEASTVQYDHLKSCLNLSTQRFKR